MPPESILQNCYIPVVSQNTLQLSFTPQKINLQPVTHKKNWHSQKGRQGKEINETSWAPTAFSSTSHEHWKAPTPAGNWRLSSGIMCPHEALLDKQAAYFSYKFLTALSD